MKRILGVILSSILLLNLAACGDTEDPSTPEESSSEAGTTTLSDGTFTGSGSGQNGPLTVDVTVSGGAISDIVFGENTETDGLGNTAFEKISSQIIEGQTLLVDTVAGATISSHGIISAVKDALKQSNPEAESALANKPEPVTVINEEVKADVIIIGSGVAGISAAIEAAKTGATVAVIEKLAVTGGSTRVSGGIVLAAGTDKQAAEGITDTAAALTEFWIERGNENVDAEMVAFVAENTSDAIDFMVEAGVNFNDGSFYPSKGVDVLRAHIYQGGAAMMTVLIEKAESLGVKIYTATKAETLIQDETGAITGVRATHAGSEQIFSGKAVIIASGGFDRSEEMKAIYSPIASGVFSESAVQNKGDGITMGIDVGAATVFKGGVIGFKSVSPAYVYTSPTTTLLNENLAALDENGDRFTNEAIDYPLLFDVMSENGSEIFRYIHDSSGENISVLEAAVDSGMAFKADTLEELAKITGLANLEASIAKYNTMIEGGVDTEFGKDLTKATPVTLGPFYAVQALRSTIGSFGGLKINLKAEVLKEDGTPILGLYAAGEVANGDFFDTTYPTSGTSIAMSTVFGREAGKSAATFASDEEE